MPIGGQHAAGEQNGPSRCWERPFQGWVGVKVGVKRAVSPIRTSAITLAISYVEQETGVEPATFCLGSRHSATELLLPVQRLPRMIDPEW